MELNPNVVKFYENVPVGEPGLFINDICERADIPLVKHTNLSTEALIAEDDRGRLFFLSMDTKKRFIEYLKQSDQPLVMRSRKAFRIYDTKLSKEVKLCRYLQEAADYLGKSYSCVANASTKGYLVNDRYRIISTKIREEN